MNMDKRGQIYILAAIVLIIAIWGVVKVVNKVEPPAEDNFDFYVENFVGERAYVMDLGYLEGGDPNKYFTQGLSGEGGDNLLKQFASMGFNVGVVMVVYDSEGWKIINYLSEDIITTCNTCEERVIPAAQGELGGLSFSLTGEGKQFFLKESTFNDLEKGDKYFVARYEPSISSVFVEIDRNKYEFRNEFGKSRRVESILFKNIDEDYIKVVKV